MAIKPDQYRETAVDTLVNNLTGTRRPRTGEIGFRNGPRPLLSDGDPQILAHSIKEIDKVAAQLDQAEGKVAGQN